MNNRIEPPINYNEDPLLSYLILESMLSGKILNTLLDIYKNNYNELISFLEFLLEEHDIDEIEEVVIGYLDIYNTVTLIPKKVDSIIGEYMD